MDMTIDQQVALDEALVPHMFQRFICRNSGNCHGSSSLYTFQAGQQETYCQFGMLQGDAAYMSKTPWRNVDFAYLMWEDFIYQVEHKDAKKRNEMYHPRFTKVIIHYFMSKDPSIPRRNKVNWHYVRDDQMFTTIKLTKASVQKTKSSFDTTVTPPLTAAAGTRLTTSAKGKQPAKASKAKNEGTGAIPRVPDVPTEESDEEISWKSSDEGDDDDNDDQDDEYKDDDDQDVGDDDDNQKEGSDDEQALDEEGEEFIHPSLSSHDEEETRDEESFDPIAKTPENMDDECNGEENLGMNVGREEGQDEEYDEDKLYRDVNINLKGRVVQMVDVHTTQEFEDSHVTLNLVNPDGQQQSSSVSSQFVTSMLIPTPDPGIDTIFETTSQMDVQAPTTVAPLPLSVPTLTPSTIATISTVPQAPTPLTTALRTLLQDLPNFGSLFRFDHRLKTLEANFSKLRDEARAENKEFLKNLDENIQKIIKEQVKEHVKVQVSKILSRIKQNVNEQLEAEVLTRSSNSSKTSYAVIVDLSEMELKKILIEKMEGNKDTVTLKRRRDDDADKDEEPSAGSDRGSKRRREGKEPGSANALKEKATRSIGMSTQGSKSRKMSASESAIAKEPMQTTHEMEEPSHPEFETGADDQPIAEPSQLPKWFSQQKKPPTLDRDWNKTLSATHESIQPWISELAKQTDSRSSFNELMDTPVDFSAFLMNRLKVDTLTPQLLDRPTYELMKGRVEDLQLDVKSYQKKLNLTRPDTYRSDLTRKLMRIDEFHKFNDGTLTDVHTALDDRLKGIRMKYLPQTIWRKSDKERAAAMI
nr:hypothetical protein [Tanacetum cinerariifolium]